MFEGFTETRVATEGGTVKFFGHDVQGAATATSVLARLKEDAAHENRNLMPQIVDAAKAYVTMGEMCDALREVWGVWRETPVF